MPKLCVRCPTPPKRLAPQASGLLTLLAVLSPTSLSHQEASLLHYFHQSLSLSLHEEAFDTLSPTNAVITGDAPDSVCGQARGQDSWFMTF